MIGLAGPLGVLGALFLTSRISRSISRKRKQDEILQEVRSLRTLSVSFFRATQKAPSPHIRSLQVLLTWLQYRGALAVHLEQALQVQDAMIKQMEAGLAEYNSKEGLLMLPSYIDILPTGWVQASGAGTYYLSKLRIWLSP